MSDIKKNEWVKPFENDKSIKIIGKIKYGLLETKEDYCRIHKQDFTNEYHMTFTGNTKWLGCPICKRDQCIQEGRIGIPIEKPIQAPEVITQSYTKSKGF